MNIALILAGGIGSRIGAEIPKQYIRVNEIMIITYCLAALAANHRIDAIQIVSEHVWQPDILKEIGEYSPNAGKIRGFSEPGKNRQLSIFGGLKDILDYAAKDDFVLIHDAVRPLLSDNQIWNCLDAAGEHDGAMPVLPMKDTVYLSKDGIRISELLDRKAVFAGQAPEVFRLGSYYEANRRLLPDDILNINGSTEPAIMAGLDIAMIQGDEKNFKITTKEDLERFKEIAAGRA